MFGSTSSEKSDSVHSVHSVHSMLSMQSVLRSDSTHSMQRNDSVHSSKSFKATISTSSEVTTIGEIFYFIFIFGVITFSCLFFCFSCLEQVPSSLRMQWFSSSTSTATDYSDFVFKSLNYGPLLLLFWGWTNSVRVAFESPPSPVSFSSSLYDTAQLNPCNRMTYGALARCVQGQS